MDIADPQIAPNSTTSIGTKFDRPQAQQYFSAGMPGSEGERGKSQNTSHNKHFGGAEWGLKVNSALFFASIVIVKRFTGTR